MGSPLRPRVKPVALTQAPFSLTPTLLEVQAAAAAEHYTSSSGASISVPADVGKSWEGLRDSMNVHLPNGLNRAQHASSRFHLVVR
jgi:hypothetical protein